MKPLYQFAIVTMLLLSSALDAAAGVTTTPPSDTAPLKDPDDARAHWAFSVRVAIDGIPISNAVGGFDQFWVEYIPLSGPAGVLSLGGTAGILPIVVPNSIIPVSYLSNYMYGFGGHYQFRYFKHQLIVPIVGFDMTFYRVKLSDTSFFNGNDPAISGGLMLSLSDIDTQTAREGYRDISETRSYLTFELRPANFQNRYFSLSATYWLFGVRMELE